MSDEEELDIVVQRERERRIERKRRKQEEITKSYYNILVIAFIVAFTVGIVIAIVIADVIDPGPSVYKPFQDAIKWGGSITTNIVFKVNQIYVVPSVISNLGRAYVTLSGGGGGGCVGNYTSTGGGGDSGASGILVPVVLNANDQCIITIGSGGDPNVDGTYTEFKCLPSSGGSPTTYLYVPGGRSGCFAITNYTSDARLGDDNYPFVSERFGSRLSPTPVYAESNPYGGIGGQNLGGGAGSAFGNGGDAGDAGLPGQNAPGYGAGGGGGGIATIVGTTVNGGKGGNGLVQLNFFVSIQS